MASMSEDGIKEQDQSLRKGVIIFAVLLALIIAVGIYLMQQAGDLNSQYESIEKTLGQN